MIWQNSQNCHLIHAHLVSGWRRGEEQICFKTSFASLTNNSIWGAFFIEYHPVESGYLLWGDCCYGLFLCRKIILKYLYRWYERSWQGRPHIFSLFQELLPELSFDFLQWLFATALFSSDSNITEWWCSDEDVVFFSNSKLFGIVSGSHDPIWVVDDNFFWGVQPQGGAGGNPFLQGQCWRS